MKFAVKNHGKVLAACDADILGKTLTEGGVNFHINRGFYFEKFVGEAEIGKLLKSSGNINIVGNKITGLAEKLGIAENTKKIKDVSYAFVFKI